MKVLIKFSVLFFILFLPWSIILYWNGLVLAKKRYLHSAENVERVILERIKTKEYKIRKQWTKDKVRLLSQMIHQFGYKYLKIPNSLSLAIIERESEFSINQASINRSKKTGKILSWDEGLGQLNSPHHSDRYRKVRWSILTKRFPKYLRDLLWPGFKRRRFKHQFIFDVRTNLGLMYWAFIECFERCSGKDHFWDRVTACYNFPAKGQYASFKKLKKFRYLKSTLRFKRMFAKSLLQTI